MPRYAGFWPRLGAILVDTVVLAPLIALSWRVFSQSRAVTLAMEIPLTCLFAFYNIYFVGKWGQTIGKMALRIKVVALDGSPAGFRRGFYRHAVDLALSILTSALTIHALMSVTAAQYDSLGFEQRLELLGQKSSSLRDVVDWLYLAWAASELVVLLTNEKRRALHDFIAGTVVVHTT